MSVAVHEDFVARQTRAKVIPALAEMIWNGLDADANRIDVEFSYDDLAGGMSKIFVHDDGDGFPRGEANALFGNLGGSWKRQSRYTKRGNRMIHGQEGRGRYKAFSLGRSVVWKVCYKKGEEGNHALQITLLDADLTDVSIGAEEPAPTRPTGVIVEINDLRHDYKALTSVQGLQELAEIFALYLINYNSVGIFIAGEKINPEKAIATQHRVLLSPIVIEDIEYPAELHIIEWPTETKRTLYLCSEKGFPLDQVETRFHVPGFSFSAYLKSRYIEESSI